MDAWIERVREVIAEVAEVDPGQVGPDSHVADLGLDSVATVELTTRMEERFGLHIPPEDLIHLTTVRAFARYASHSGKR